MAYGESPVHALDPRVKLAATVAFAVAVALVPGGHGVRLTALGVLLVAVIGAAGLPITYVLKRTALVLPFVGLVALAVPFTHDGTPVWSVNLAGFNLTASRPGVLLAATMVIKACLVAACLLVLAGTTRFPRLLYALRWYRLPEAFVMLLAFLYRYLFLVIDQGHHMKQARRSRCARRRPRGGLRTTGSMISNLVVRSFDRAERVHQAMISRGHDGRIRILEPLYGRPAHLVQCAAFALLSLSFALTPWPEFASWMP
jgi:cobalt/nickel transport system permease protein